MMMIERQAVLVGSVERISDGYHTRAKSEKCAEREPESECALPHITDITLPVSGSVHVAIYSCRAFRARSLRGI